jgi:hypothetical protein
VDEFTRNDYKKENENENEKDVLEWILFFHALQFFFDFKTQQLGVFLQIGLIARVVLCVCACVRACVRAWRKFVRGRGMSEMDVSKED